MAYCRQTLAFGMVSSLASEKFNLDNMDCIYPCLVIVGTSTEVIASKKLIITAGAIVTHVHYICPQVVPEALTVSTTTMIKRGTGPNTGTNATTCTSSPFISSIC